ncbi:MAG TPA: hypothetical protein DCS93_20810 [Microscillaceae bacterium]|nr:hypothetical protein [Microscillaceae bacterium]
MHLFEFGDYLTLPFDQEKTQRLKHYLNTVWQNRALFYEETSSHLSTQQRLFDFDENRIRARNYVGFFRFEGIEFQVLPKIFNVQPSPSADLCFQHVLYYLSYSRRIRFPFSLTRIDATPSLLLPEICIFLFAAYTENLLIEHPTQLYQERTEELSFLKGQLAVEQYVQENLATGNWQKLHSRHAPLLYDNRFNQIVKYTTRWLLSVTQHGPTRERLQRILHLLQHISNASVTYEDCLKVRLGESQSAQQAVLDMCTMFLGNEMINYQVGQKYNFAFLLPMEIVYEDFIAGFIQKHFSGWQPKIQPKRYLGTNEAGKNIGLIQPDILLQNPAMILDTKYKIRKQHHAVEDSDLYQMLAYATGFQCKQLALLYPQVFEQAAASPECFTLNQLATSQTLDIYAVNLDLTIHQTTNLTQSLEKKVKQQLMTFVDNLIS